MFGPLCFGPIRAHLIHGEVDVFANRQPGKQGIILEDHAAFRVRSGNGFAVHQHLATVRAGQTGEQGNQGGFPGAGETDDGHEITFLHHQVHVPQYLRAVMRGAVAFADVFEFQEGHFIYDL